MEIEHHQLDLRFDATRLRDPQRESRLSASLLAHGQRQPVLVFSQQQRFVLVDGYRRVRALAAIGRDTVAAMDLGCSEVDALLYAWSASVGRRPEAIEEAWLLREVLDLGALQQHALAERMGRSISWISRRLGLLAALPERALLAVREGRVTAHGAQKVLVPLARAKREHCERLLGALGDRRISSRQMQQWWSAYREADAQARARLVDDPWLYLRSIEALATPVKIPKESPEGRLIHRLGAAAGACARARTELAALLTTHPEVRASDDVHGVARHTRNALRALESALGGLDVGRGEAGDDLAAGARGPTATRGGAGDGRLAELGQTRAALG